LNHAVTISGGGLAGLSLGIALRRCGVPVCITEAAAYPRHRVCGEFISGVSIETLDTLGIRPCFEGARLHRSVAWHHQGRPVLRDQLTQPALGLSRHLLDQRLAESFTGMGGVLATGIRARPNPATGHVWAAGRRPVTGRWIGLKAHVRLATCADLEMHAGSNGYAGLAGVEDGWTNVCGLFLLDRTILAGGSALLPAYLEAGGNRRLAAALRAAVWREGSFHAVAGFVPGHQPALPGVLCLGDAAEMIPPFTGNGMSMAFQSAEMAVGPLFDWAAGRLSWQAACERVRHELRHRFRRRMAVSSLLHPWLFREGGRAVVESLAPLGLLPFRPLLSLVR
jgi:2-polyprenyl-6-methoxyphenol hydroxylase-like FAD-dependent oxidoreductase